MSTLSEKIDEVWRSDAPRRTVAASIVKSASIGDKLKLIAVDISTLINRIPYSMDVREEAGEVEISFNSTVVLAKIGDCSAQHDLAYADALICLQIFGIKLEGAPLSRSIENILVGSQLARDHSDSALYLPQELREKRIREWSDESRLPQAQFIFLATSIRRMLELIR